MPRRPAAKKEAKRRKIVKDAIQGKRTKVIAKRVGSSSRDVQRILAEEKTQYLISEALAPYRERLTKIAAKAIGVIEKGLSSMKHDKQDHFHRLKSIERWSDLLGLAQGKIKEAPPQVGIPTYTYEELNALYKARIRTPGDEDEEAQP